MYGLLHTVPAYVLTRWTMNEDTSRGGEPQSLESHFVLERPYDSLAQPLLHFLQTTNAFPGHCRIGKSWIYDHAIYL